jgi:uncharacterized membrane protein
VATLTGAAVGAGAGGLVGGLIGLGIPEDEAKEYEGYVESGKILVLVEDNGRGYQAHDVFRDNRSLNAQRYEGVYNEDTRLGNSMANRADRTAEVYNRDKI